MYVTLQIESMTSKLMEDMDMEEPPTIKFGDASVAAPFTSKLSNVVASKCFFFFHFPFPTRKDTNSLLLRSCQLPIAYTTAFRRALPTFFGTILLKWLPLIQSIISFVRAAVLWLLLFRCTRF